MTSLFPYLRCMQERTDSGFASKMIVSILRPLDEEGTASKGNLEPEVCYAR